MKKLRGVCAAGWGEPCPALRDASETSTNRGNALGRGESSPQLEMGTAHFLVFEPFPYLELALVALAEIPEADAEGVFPLDWTQCYDERRHRAFWILSFLFFLRAEFRISPKEHKPRKMESISPKLLFPLFRVHLN